MTLTFDTFLNQMQTTSHKCIMHLNIFVDTEDETLKDLYINAANSHNQKIYEDPHFYDAGFDLFLPGSFIFENNVTNKVDFKVKCCAKQHKVTTPDKSIYSPFYTYARSSISKTPVRLANNQGIIDAGYRGNIIGMFDCFAHKIYWEPEKYVKLIQICAPSLMPIYVNIVSSHDELGPVTQRGEKGFGSTGK